MNEISTEWDDKPCDIAGTLRALADKWENEVHVFEDVPMFKRLREQGYSEETVAWLEEQHREAGIDPATVMMPVLKCTYDKRESASPPATL